MATFTQTITQGAKNMALVADAIKGADPRLLRQIENGFQKNTLREQAVTGAGSILDRLPPDISPWPLQATNDQHAAVVFPDDAEGQTRQQSVIPGT